MKAKLAAMLAIAVILLWPPLPSQSQQPTQPIRYYGYIGPTTDSDLSRVRSYTNFTYLDGEYGVSMVDTVTRVRNYGMRTIIDLGKVLWCPSPGVDMWHLCDTVYGDVPYDQRFRSWKSTNCPDPNVTCPVTDASYVLAYSVMTEHTKRGVPTSDVERAITLVKQETNWQIPTLVSEGLVDVENANFGVPYNVDWVALAAYYTHPNIDQEVKDAVDKIKGLKQWWQKTGYTMDAFYTQNHANAGILLDNMDSIAQEWYTFASRDPEAILIGAFLWYQAPDTGGIGSSSFPQHVLDKHAAIGQAIFAGRFPTYQGYFENIDCQTVSGWAWDSSQPNSPVSVDVYDGGQKLAIVRANQFRSDLQYYGYGNGYHGFTFSLPPGIRNGQTHWITIKYSGLDEQLYYGPRSITCNNYEGYVDVGDCNSIIGWAADRYRLNTSIRVGIYDNGALVANVWATDYRGDVGQYLGDNGYHGFAIPTPANFKDGTPHTLSVRFESGWTNLSGSPRTLTCAPPYYEIVARHSGKCLDVEGESTASGARVIQFGCGGWPNQQWQILPVGGGYYKIVARHSGKVLDVQWAGMDNGTPVWQWDENGTAAQQWAITDVGGGYVWIMARHSGKALDVAGGYTTDGTPVHQWDYVGIPNQQWQLRQVP